MAKKDYVKPELEKATDAKTPNSQAVTTAKKAEQYMYIGANLIKEGLLQYRVYRGGKPAIIETLKEKYPLISALFVKIDEIEKARAEIKKQGTALYLANEQIINGGVK